jgi:streptogramin lyase
MKSRSGWMRPATVALAAASLSVVVAGCGRASGLAAVTDPSGIGGIVLNGDRPEAGVWVIAETSHLPTGFTRIVVTDDEGRFLIPDLPAAPSYDVWVRGYGLRDSDPVRTAAGDAVTLQVEDARSPQEAAKIYPANCWLSLYEPPADQHLPLIGRSRHTSSGEGGPAEDRDEETSETARAFPRREHWVGHVKLGCMLCHQLGQEISRLFTRPEHWDAIWDRAGMRRTAESLGLRVLTNSLAEWGARIEGGTVPPAPPRPSGIERHMVITQWAWARDDSYIHDNVSTDKRQPTLYPHGKVWGIDIGQSFLWSLDPVTHTVESHEVPLRDGPGREPDRPGRIQGLTSSHNPMLDDKGNVWLTTRVRGYDKTPAWADQVTADITSKETGRQKSGLSERDLRASRHLGYYSSTERKFVLIDTAFATHHLQFDTEGRLWTSGDNSRLGMFDPAKFDPSRPVETEATAQTGWAAIDPATGKSAMGGGYGIIVSPVDGTIWRANYPGIFGQAPLPDLSGNYIDRFDPEQRTYKRYPIPLPGYGPRGIDATTDGRLWFGTGSGHLVGSQNVGTLS